MPDGGARSSGAADERGGRGLLGRNAELDQLDAWLDDVVARRARPLLLQGEPGAGKTSLLRAVRARAAQLGARAVTVLPIPTATTLTLAGLNALVAQLQMDPDGEERVGVELSGADGSANPLVLSGELVALLAAAADAQPIVVIIDDGQWLDRTSAEVILAALGGLTLDQVGLVVAARSGEPHPFAGLQRLTVLGLSRSAVTEVFAHLHIADAVLAQCWEATAGNPLALGVVLAKLNDDERRGASPLPDPLPVADVIAAALRHRLQALPAATQLALVVLAADTASSSTTVGVALALLGGSLIDLDAAEDGAVISVSGGRLAFTNPLLRATALGMASASQRRDAHRALAAAHDLAGEPEPRAWQLAAAAAGPDDSAADALAEVAQHALRRGATAVAADGFLTAAHLSTTPALRVARLAAAGRAAWVLGRVDEATRTLNEALDAAQTRTEQADIELLLGLIELWARGPRIARDRFLAAIDPGRTQRRGTAATVEHADPNIAARLLGHAAATAMVSGDVRGTLHLARRAATLATSDDPAATIQATLTLGYLETHAGEPGGISRLEPIIQMASALAESDDPDVVGFLGLVGMCLIEAERLEEAEPFLVAVVRRSRSEGASASGAMASAILAEKHWRTGNWLEAAHLASTAVVPGATLPVNRAWATAFLAHLDAGAGRAQACRQRAAAAVREGGATEAGVALIWAGHAMGLLEIGSGRWPHAARQLDRVAALTEALGRHLPGAVWWQGDHIEALARAERHDDAHRALARLDAERTATTQRWPACVAARGRALLTSDLDEAVAELTRSIELAEAIPAPFEAARSRLLRGERLLGHDGAAVDDLRDALSAFDRLGASAFADRTRVLLGEPVAARATTDLADLLTPAELRVALAVARGATNREVAADLFVSNKTIDYHLQNVYRKLSLRSRTELALRVAQATAT